MLNDKDTPKKALDAELKRLLELHCRSKELIRSLDDVCEDCPLKIKIPAWIAAQIVPQAEEQLRNFPRAIANEYRDQELRDVSAQLNELSIEAMKPGTDFGAVTECYIWNVERGKAISQVFSDNLTTEHQLPPEGVATGLPVDRKEQLASEYISTLLERYQAAFLERYDRSLEPALLLERERELWRKTALTDKATGVKLYRGLGGTVTAAIGAKYHEPNPSNWNRSLAGWINYLAVLGGGNVADYVTFTEIDPNATQFDAGDAMAVYRFYKWLASYEGEQKPLDSPTKAEEGTGIHHSKTKILKLFLGRPHGAGGTHELYRLVVQTVPKRNGDERKLESVKALYSKWKKRPSWITDEVISRIIKELKQEGKPIDYDYLRLLQDDKTKST